MPASLRADTSTQQPFFCLTLPALFPAPDAAWLSRSNGDGPGAPFHHTLNHTIMPRWPEPSSSPQMPPLSRCTAGKETRCSNSILLLGCDQNSGHFSPKENTSMWCNCQDVKA